MSEPTLAELREHLMRAAGCNGCTLIVYRDRLHQALAVEHNDCTLRLGLDERLQWLDMPGDAERRLVPWMRQQHDAAARAE